MNNYLNYKEERESEFIKIKSKEKERSEISIHIKEFLSKGKKIKKYNNINKKIRMTKRASERYHSSRQKTIEPTEQI